MCKSMSRGEIKGCFHRDEYEAPEAALKAPRWREGSSFPYSRSAGHGGEHLEDRAEEKQMEPVWENVNFGKALRRPFTQRSPAYGGTDTGNPANDQQAEAGDRAELRRLRFTLPAMKRPLPYSSTRQKVSMCIPVYGIERPESMANLVMETSPNIVLIVGR